MDVNKQDRFVDELLDASLKQLRSDEPRVGMEGRILAGVRAREVAAQRRRSRSWTWALCGAAGLTALVLVGLLPHRRQVPSQGPIASPPPLTVTKSATPAVGERSALLPGGGQLLGALHPRERVGSLTRAGRARPYRAVLAAHRPEQFPTPTPLTEQERLLLLYVQSGSQLGNAVGANAPGKGGELEIPALNIAALDPIKPLSAAGGGTRD